MSPKSQSPAASKRRAASGFSRTVFLPVAIAALSWSMGATAAGWQTAKLEWQYYAYGGPIDGGGSPDQCKVRRGRCHKFYRYFRIMTDPTSITFDYATSGNGSTWSSSPLSLPPTIYNGIALNLLSPGTIKSVTIDPATSMVGFDTSRLSFTAKQIQVDWQNLAFDASTIVKLDVTVAKTPQPLERTVVDNPPKMPDAR